MTSWRRLKDVTLRTSFRGVFKTSAGSFIKIVRIYDFLVFHTTHLVSTIENNIIGMSFVLCLKLTSRGCPEDTTMQTSIWDAIRTSMEPLSKIYV